MLTVRQHAPRLLDRLLGGFSRPPVELVYESHSSWPQSSQTVDINKPLRISVLDSSFNPPTLAHLALANSKRPSEWTKDGDPESEEYDAKLLLLSVKNADKKLMPGDASYLQRLEMMTLLTQRITCPHVAIAITDEPTFVGKSDALLEFLNQKLSISLPSPDIELTFLVGTDTLQRLFSPRYYSSESTMMVSLTKFLSPAPEGDNSRVVSAKRVLPSMTSHSMEMEEAKVPAMVKRFLDSDRIATIDIGEKTNTYSSSAIRSAITQDGLTSGDETMPLWRNLTTPELAQYIVEQQLYVVNPDFQQPNSPCST